MTTPNLVLVGKNLGERHQYLNNIVKEASERVEDFYSMDDLPEETPLNRILKIKLAIKQEHIDYILKTLKDDDMLYISKALKSKWLVKTKFEHIVNPQYLEDYQFPLMVTTAVTKMKHWIVVNLKDPKRCQLFFQYYHEKNIEYAIKFLRNCSASFIEETFPKVKYSISPKEFAILSERNPQVAFIFFDFLATDEKLKEIYLAKEKCYFNTLRKLLKTNTDMVLNIAEKYFNKMMVKCFSPKATKFIIEHHKERFLKKPELYTALLLDTQVLARCINIEEAMELTLRLAKDSYLNSINWFSYKQVEPLIKRLKPENRGAFKKKIFVEKDIGDEIKEWPYLIPSPPILIEKCCPIFEDYEHNPNMYQISILDYRKILKKRKYSKWNERKDEKTLLNKLFGEYRVASFDRTLFELRKRIMAESSPQNRQYMMLVLVSKSGGREDNIASLMELLSKFTNEPPQIRAAIVRSLVKRTQIWRVAENIWELFLKFGHGIGLDGNHSEANCIEGIHAMVIRKILIERKCDTKIFSIYMDNFSTLITYSLSSAEKRIISDLLPKMLFYNACQEDSALRAVNIINKLLDTLTAFKLETKTYPGLIARIKYLAEKDVYQTDVILKRLFKAKIARQELFKVNFKIMQSEDSHLNALRHDVTVISVHGLIKVIKDSKKTYKNFFSKISIYFNEKDGLSNEFLVILKAEKHLKILAKPLALLLGNELESYIKNIDSSNDTDKMFIAAIKANAHLARPAFNIGSFGWKNVGTKAIANKVLICRDTQICNYITKLRQNIRTIKLGFILANRKGDFTHVFTDLCNMKPTAALKTGLKILRNYKDFSFLGIWNTIKPLMENLDITSDTHKYLNIADVTSMPIEIRPEYCIIIYKAYKEKSFIESLPFLCHIENLLQNINDEFTKNVLFEFFNNNFQNQLADLDEYSVIISHVCM